MKGFKPAELINPAEIPMHLMLVWTDFLSLSSARQSGMAANPISYSEIKAYCELMNRHLTRNEVEIIKRLDTMVLNQSKESK